MALSVNHNRHWRPPFLRLPSELLSLIFDELDHQLSAKADAQTVQRTFASYSLICAALLPYARAHVVRTLDLHTLPGCLRSLRLARRAPHLYRHARALRISDRVYLSPGWAALAREVLGWDADALERKCAPGPERRVGAVAGARYVPWERLGRGVVAELLAPLGPRLTTLALSWVLADGPPRLLVLPATARMAVLDVFKDVTRLVIAESQFRDADALHALLERFPRLSALAIEHDTLVQDFSGKQLPPRTLALTALSVRMARLTVLEERRVLVLQDQLEDLTQKLLLWLCRCTVEGSLSSMAYSLPPRTGLATMNTALHTAGNGLQDIELYLDSYTVAEDYDNAFGTIAKNAPKLRSLTLDAQLTAINSGWRSAPGLVHSGCRSLPGLRTLTLLLPAPDPQANMPPYSALYDVVHNVLGSLRDSRMQDMVCQLIVGFPSMESMGPGMEPQDYARCIVQALDAVYAKTEGGDYEDGARKYGYDLTLSSKGFAMHTVFMRARLTVVTRGGQEQSVSRIVFDVACSGSSVATPEA